MGAAELLAALLLCSTCSCAAAASTKDPEDLLVFAGAAGCDAADHDCIGDEPGAEQYIWKYVLRDKGPLEVAGKLKVEGLPAWLVWAPQLPQCLFAALVTKDSIASFQLDANADMVPREPVPSGGVNPVYASVSADGKTLLVANYHGPDDAGSSEGASVASFRVAKDCSLTLASTIPHNGSSVVQGRQNSAHPHSFVAAPRGKLAFACDLGADLVTTYKVSSDGQLEELHRTKATAGDGPRHLVLHPLFHYAYVVNELGNSVRVYHVGGTGELTAEQSFSTLPPGASTVGNKAAELVLSSDGAFLYVSNRGRSNSVCTFAIMDDGKTLKQLQHVDVLAYPRGMTLAQQGPLLIVASQHFGTLQPFRAGTTGALEWTGVNATAPPTVATLAVVDRSKCPTQADDRQILTE